MKLTKDHTRVAQNEELDALKEILIGDLRKLFVASSRVMNLKLENNAKFEKLVSEMHISELAENVTKITEFVSKL